MVEPYEEFHFVHPDARAFNYHMAKIGVKAKSYVVTYDTSEKNFFGNRCAWVLQVMGHNKDRVKVLDGGLAAWQALGLPIERG